MPIHLIPTLARIVGVEPGHAVEWFDVSDWKPRVADFVPINDFHVALIGCELRAFA